MASRLTARSIKTTTVSQTASGETPKTGTSPSRRTRSPSPARITRMQEKEQLSNLNDRLAAYIDKVRYLENENSRLTVQIRSSEETVTREVGNIKALYESELAEARKLLDDTAKEKAKLQLEANKYKTEADDWQAKYHRRDRDAKNAEKKILDLQAELADALAKLDDAENKKKHAEAEAARLRGEVASLERQLAALRKQLEEETLLRVDLENRIQSLKEELAFKSQVYEQELNETRTRTSTSIDEYDAGVREEYETKLQDALRTMREEGEEQLRQVREEVEYLYERKVADLQGALDRSMSVGSTSREEYLVTKRRVDELNSELARLKGQNASLEARVKELEDQLSRDQDEYEQGLRVKDLQIIDLRQALADQTQEYADLLDVKLRLDQEIAAYRKLLEGEEERLNLSASFEQTTPKKGKGLKRKRVTMEMGEQSIQRTADGYATESQASGAVEVTDTDEKGRYIKLFNTSDDDIVMGNYVLKHTAEDKETVYKFHRNLHMKPNSYITVWSSDAGQTHNPPTDLVMKGQSWFVADQMKTVLLKDDLEVASRELKKSTMRTLSSRYRSLGEDEVDSGREKCSIM